MSNRSAFHDHFSGVATGYSEFRPHYPAELFDALAAIAPNRDFVWDCAAGSGQASVALSEKFDVVFATDASVKQIAQAEPRANVFTAVATAEACPLLSGTASLVTVAQALHWFDVNTFYEEAKRVLIADGVLCVWAYGLLRVDENKSVEQSIDHFSEHVLGKWWPPQRRHVDAGYSSLPFPFERIPIGPFDMSARWTFEQVVGYLRTWSSVSAKMKAEGVDPVATFEPELRRAWGDSATLALRWPLTVLAGRPA